MAYLQDAEVELPLPVGGWLGALVLLCWGDKRQRFCSRRVVDRECEVVPVDNNGKVVPGSAGKRGRE